VYIFLILRRYSALEKLPGWTLGYLVVLNSSYRKQAGKRYRSAENSSKDVE
jgi:hypothetical protein